MSLSEFLSLLSGILFLPVILIYFLQVKKGKVEPNRASWLVWMILSVINAASYYWVAGKDYYKMTLITMAAGSITFLFFYSAKTGKFKKLTPLEQASIAIALLVIPYGLLTKNALISYLVINGLNFAMFIPTIIRIVEKDKEQRAKENPLAWSLATLAYSVNAYSIIISPNGWDWQQLVYPIAIGIIGNGSVGLCAFIMNKKTKEEL